MNKKEFDTLLPLISADIVGRIAKEYCLSENEAILTFTKTRLYELLEREETKLWHYSTEMLLHLYKTELCGNLTFPQV